MELDSKRSRRLGSVANSMTLVNVLERQVNDLEVEINTLPDVTFDVVKLSRFNHTNKKITVTNGGIRIFYHDIKKRVDFVPFDGVSYMKLTGEDKVCFSLKGFKNEKVYETKDASYLAQLVRVRRHKTLNLHKRKMLLLMSYRFYSKLNQDPVANKSTTNWKISRPTKGKDSPSILGNYRIDRNIELNTPSEEIININVRESLTEEDLNSLERLLMPIILSPKKFEEARVIKNFVDSFESYDKTAEGIASKIRELLDSVRERIMNVHACNFLNELVHPIELDLLSSSIEKILQKTIIGQLYHRIMNMFIKQLGAVDNLIEKKKVLIRQLDQRDLGVPEKLITNTNWMFAVLELSNMSNYTLPFEKLECILSCVRAVVDTAKIEKSYSEASGISADDLIPIMIYVVSNSSAVHLESICQYLWLLSDPTELSGEGGYYLTLFSSVVEYIKNYEKLDTIQEVADPIRLKTSTTPTYSNSMPDPTLLADSPPTSDKFNQRKRSGSFTTPTTSISRKDIKSAIYTKGSSQYNFLCVPLIVERSNRKKSEESNSSGSPSSTPK